MSIQMANQIRELEARVGQLERLCAELSQRLDARAEGMPDPVVDPMPDVPPPACLRELKLIEDDDGKPAGSDRRK